MAQRKQRNKLKPAEIEKVKARYKTKLEEFSEMTIDELVEKSTTKMSFTDKRALVHAFSLKKPKITEEDGTGIDSE